MRMKKISHISLLIMILIIATGCSKSKKTEVTTKELANSITDKLVKDTKVASSDKLNWNKIDLLSEKAAPILERIKVKADVLEEGIVLEDAAESSANRILILKVKEDKDINKVKLALDELKKTQEESYKNGVKDEYKKVKEGIVTTHNKYIYYIVYDDIQGIKKILDDATVK